MYPTNSTVLICGDFNLPNINWSIDNCLKCCDTTCPLRKNYWPNHMKSWLGLTPENAVGPSLHVSLAPYFYYLIYANLSIFTTVSVLGG